MVAKALSENKTAKKILDPACGPATFSRALHESGETRIELHCYDVDERMTNYTVKKNKEYGFRGSTKLKDYLADTSLAGSFDIAIMNPPYIRQENIPHDAKKNYHDYLTTTLCDSVDKRANLFALFLLKGLIDLKVGGILCAIVYDAIMSSAYGKKTLALINRHADLLSSTAVQAPFEKVLVDAQILLYRKRASPTPKSGENRPSNKTGYVPLETLLQSRRGTALPARKGFLAKNGELYYRKSVPFFIKQGSLNGLIVKPDTRAYLAESLINNRNVISTWLQKRAQKIGIHLSRTSIPGVKGYILFNYYIRSNPRHLWNKNNVAVSDNFYVSLTTCGFPAEAAWLLLNSDLYLEKLLEVSRNQGNGLRKLQLYEYKMAQVPDWRNLSEKNIFALEKIAKKLLANDAAHDDVRMHANNAAERMFNGKAKTSKSYRSRKHTLSSSL